MPYTINEECARTAHNMNFMEPYKTGSMTNYYNEICRQAEEIGEAQKKEVDPMYHDKIDYLVDKYCRLMANNINAHNRIDAMEPSILIAGGSGINNRRKQKQNDARDRNLEEYNKIQEILNRIQSVGTGGISSDDENAIQKLELKLEQCRDEQEKMKAVNAYYRKNKTCIGCPDLTEAEQKAFEARHEKEPYNNWKPYYPYCLSNNNQEIHRLEKRLEELKEKIENPFKGWEFDGGYVNANLETNRLEVYFDEKPDDEIISQMKHHSFKWAPSKGVWQRMLNWNALWAANDTPVLKPLNGKTVIQIQQER